MLRRLLYALLWPLGVFLVGGLFFTALSALTDTERNVSLLFLLWISFLPVVSGWAVGSHTPRPVPETALRTAIVWGVLPLLAVCLLPGVYPGPGLFCWVLGAAALSGFGVYLGAAYTMGRHIKAGTKLEEEEQ